MDQKHLFDFLLQRVKETSQQSALPEPQAFIKWFTELYYERALGNSVPDGSNDGKVDYFFKTLDGDTVEHHVINGKFTAKYNNPAPAKFYDEIICFWQAFENKANREAYLESNVRPRLRDEYRNLFGHYDEGRARLMFVTNFRRGSHYGSVKFLEKQDRDGKGLKIFHLEDLLQHLIDDLDGAMPRTPEMLLTGINQVLSPAPEDTKVSMSIVFAKLDDFIRYMKDDQNDLLFARNIRKDLGDKGVNKDIKTTFERQPKEFAFSNNGITMFCEEYDHKPGTHELVLQNPRVVNGSQTLHSVRRAGSFSPNARVMVRIIRIPPIAGDDLPSKVAEKKDIINKISLRSNQQNPIKKRNLVANDEFQMEIYRYFRRKELFYERRDNEWKDRSAQLKGVGVKRGPGLQKLTQLVAAFHWDDKKLGPANAKVSSGGLFDEEPYRIIRSTKPETVYQIYQLNQIIGAVYPELPKIPKYFGKLKGHADLALLSLVVRALGEGGVGWGRAESTALLESFPEAPAKTRLAWRDFVRDAVSHLNAAYVKESGSYKKQEGVDLPYNTYFKSQSRVGEVFNNPLSGKLLKAARRVASL